MLFPAQGISAPFYHATGHVLGFAGKIEFSRWASRRDSDTGARASDGACGSDPMQMQ